MSKPLELLAKRLKTATEGEYGRKAKFCRAVKMSASQVDDYINGKTSPTLAVIERLAEHWGEQPWELIRPPGAEATPIPRIDAGELGPIIAAMLAHPEKLDRVRVVLGLPAPASKRKNS